MTQLKAPPNSAGMMAIDDPREARRIIRSGAYGGHTAGVAPEFVALIPSG